MIEFLGMGLGPIIVILIRLLVPLSVFKWPLFGAITSQVADALDVVLITLFNMGDFPPGSYAAIDKALDWYFYLFLAIISLKWETLAKWTSIALFSWRTIGVVLFEITGLRILLFIFPNLFLWFYLFWAARNKYFPKFELTKKKLAIILLVLLIPKLIQEYILHVIEAQPWNWIKLNLL